MPFYDAGAAVARAVGTLTVCVFALNKKSHREYRDTDVFFLEKTISLELHRARCHGHVTCQPL